jgi:hypothetical protein
MTRQRLKAFIPRLLRVRRGPAAERIGVRLAVWAAASIAEGAPDRFRGLAWEAVEAAAGRVDGWVSEATCRAAAATAAEAGAKVRDIPLYVAADAAHAACADDPSGATVNALAGALHWVIAHGDPVNWFGALLDAHAAAWSAECEVALDVAEEGVCSPV